MNWKINLVLAVLCIMEYSCTQSKNNNLQTENEDVDYLARTYVFDAPLDKDTAMLFKKMGKTIQTKKAKGYQFQWYQFSPTDSSYAKAAKVLNPWMEMERFISPQQMQEIYSKAGEFTIENRVRLYKENGYELPSGIEDEDPTSSLDFEFDGVCHFFWESKRYLHGDCLWLMNYVKQGPIENIGNLVPGSVYLNYFDARIDTYFKRDVFLIDKQSGRHYGFSDIFVNDTILLNEMHEILKINAVVMQEGDFYDTLSSKFEWTFQLDTTGVIFYRAFSTTQYPYNILEKGLQSAILVPYNQLMPYIRKDGPLWPMLKGITPPEDSSLKKDNSAMHQEQLQKLWQGYLDLFRSQSPAKKNEMITPLEKQYMLQSSNKVNGYINGYLISDFLNHAIELHQCCLDTDRSEISQVLVRDITDFLNAYKVHDFEKLIQAEANISKELS